MKQDYLGMQRQLDICKSVNTTPIDGQNHAWIIFQKKTLNKIQHPFMKKNLNKLGLEGLEGTYLETKKATWGKLTANPIVKGEKLRPLLYTSLGTLV